jgi:hypothetical protein
MLEKMKLAVQSIALPSHAQISLFPDFVEVADELALSWEESLNELPQVRDQLTSPQVMAVNELDAYILSISGAANEDLWTIEALTVSVEWQTMRALAGQILKQMNWSATILEKSPDIFLRAAR